MTPTLDLAGELDSVQSPLPPKLDLASELNALTPSQLAVGSRYLSPQTLQQVTGTTNIPTPPLNFGEQILHVLGSPVTGWGTTAQGQMTDDYRKALDSLTMVTGPLAMPMVGGEAMTELILRRGGQLLRGIAARFGKAPEQVAQDIAQSVQRQPETATTSQPGTTLAPITPKPLDLAGELNAMKAMPSPGPTVLDRPQMAMAPPSPSAGPIPSLTIPTELVEPIGKLSLNRRIVGAAQELFTQAGIERTPGTKISDQITDLLGSQKLPIPEMDKTLQRYGLTFTDFANGIFRPAIADAGRRLQTLSALERQINQMAQKSGTSEDLNRLVQIGQELARADGTAAGRAWWQKVDAIRRGLLVTNLSSVVKRTEMGIARVGLNGMQDALDAGLQKAFNLPQTANPLEGLEALGNVVRGGRPAQLNQILAQFPSAKERLFNEYASEVATGAGGLPLRGADAAFQTAQKAISVLNVATRAQEHLIRGSVFQANLASRVAAGGDDLVRMIAEKRLGEIPDSAIQGAVQKALETTFGAQPAYGSPAAAFMRVVNGIPGASLAIPFPKHLVNSLKFYWDYSPFGILKLLMPSERAAIAAGNTQAISRAVLGTAMLGGAVAFRASPFAGERWYEGRLPDGRTVNLRPFNPFLPYLLVGDMIHRQRTGTLVHPYQTKDVLDAALSVNVSAGTGLLLVDWLVAGMQGEAGQKTISRLQQLAGETLGGFLTPLRQLQDALAEFNPQPRRETRGEPFWGPIKSQIPGLAETLPAAESPTHTGGYVPQNPLVRQLTALGIYQQKNPAERELDRFQFNRNEIMPSSGDPEADRLIAKHMGALVERTLVPIVQSPGYQQLSNAQRGVLLQNILGPLHNEARNEAIAENPRLFVQLQLQRLPTRERLLLQEGGVSLPAR